jgi:hypothetical protein
MPPPNAMTRRFEIESGGKTFSVVVDEKGVEVRELGKRDTYQSPWKDVAEFVIKQQFFTFKK